jgi:hypothetical protein
MTDPVVAKRARAQLALELHRGDGGFLGKSDRMRNLRASPIEADKHARRGRRST